MIWRIRAFFQWLWEYIVRAKEYIGIWLKQPAEVKYNA